MIVKNHILSKFGSNKVVTSKYDKGPQEVMRLCAKQTEKILKLLRSEKIKDDSTIVFRVGLRKFKAEFKQKKVIFTEETTLHNFLSFVFQFNYNHMYIALNGNKNYSLPVYFSKENTNDPEISYKILKGFCDHVFE